MIRYVSVIGQGVCDAETAETGETLGKLLAEAGVVVICGGMGGVMAAVARGVQRAHGVSIGILPTMDRDHANPHLTYSVCTGIGHARNLAVVASGDVVIALGGHWGTLSEIGLARCADRRVILLRSWRLDAPRGPLEGIEIAQTPQQAVRLALRPHRTQNESTCNRLP